MLLANPMYKNSRRHISRRCQVIFHFNERNNSLRCRCEHSSRATCLSSPVTWFLQLHHSVASYTGSSCGVAVTETRARQLNYYRQCEKVKLISLFQLICVKDEDSCQGDHSCYTELILYSSPLTWLLQLNLTALALVVLVTETRKRHQDQLNGVGRFAFGMWFVA